MKKSGITLNKNTYPLYVGGTAVEDFQDKDEKGSSVLLEAEIDSESFTFADISWSVENTDIADFAEDVDEQREEGKRRVRARRTGITTVHAVLPDGSRAECCIAVIDNYARFTVSEIVLNTNRLHLEKGKSAQLIPILYPKDILGNGMLDSSLIWESGNEEIVCVEAGKVTAIGNGEATIVVRSADVGRVATCQVVVSETLEMNMTSV